MVYLTLHCIPCPVGHAKLKFLFQFKKGSSNKIYERRDYESVDDKSEKRHKKEFRQYKAAPTPASNLCGTSLKVAQATTWIVRVLYSSINSIKNCRSSAVPLEDIALSIVLQITTAGTTTRCQLRVIPGFVCASKHSNGASIGCLRKKYQTVLISRKQFTQECNQHPTLSKCLCKHSVCANCLHV